MKPWIGPNSSPQMKTKKVGCICSIEGYLWFIRLGLFFLTWCLYLFIPTEEAEEDEEEEEEEEE